jgi:protein tyrosine/serine phosphatase
MEPIGLVGLAIGMMDLYGEGVARAMRAYAAPPDGAASIVHCSQGKDRTGLVVALVLMALGVPLAAVDHDYRLSDGALDAERESRLCELHEMGLDDKWIDTDPGMIRAVNAHLETKYGGLEAYLDSAGFGETDRAALRKRLLL